MTPKHSAHFQSAKLKTSSAADCPLKNTDTAPTTTGSVITLRLPYPDSRLFPNRKTHWAKKLKSKNAQLALAYSASSSHRGRLGKQNYPVKIVFVPNSNRRFDLDGALSASKSTLDGVAKGLGIDDSQFRPITLDSLPAQKEAHVIMEIIL